MADSNVYVVDRPVIDSDNIFSGPVQVPLSASPPAPGTLTTILSYQTKPGKRCFIAVIANDVDAGGIGSVYMQVTVNGIPLKDYTFTVNQWTSPQLLSRLPVRIEVSQLATVAMSAYNVSASNYNGYGRILFEYEDF